MKWLWTAYNPPRWVTLVLKKEYRTIAQAFGEQYLPRDVDKNELGTGHYGTVFSTADPGKVLKITSDPTEAEFVRFLGTLPEKKRNWDEELSGLVRYYGIVALESTYRRRQVNAILREAAHTVGYYKVIQHMMTVHPDYYVRQQSLELNR